MEYDELVNESFSATTTSKRCEIDGKCKIKKYIIIYLQTDSRERVLVIEF